MTSCTVPFRVSWLSRYDVLRSLDNLHKYGITYATRRGILWHDVYLSGPERDVAALKESLKTLHGKGVRF